MPSEAAGPGTSNMKSFGNSNNSSAPSTANVAQKSMSTSAFSFSSSTVAGSSSHNSNAAPKTTGNPVQSSSVFFCGFGVPCSNTTTTPISQAVLAANNLNPHQFGRFLCISCNKHTDPHFGFCCWSCNNFYHNQCPTASAAFGSVLSNNVLEFGLPVCKHCHARRQDTTPAPFPVDTSFKISRYGEINNARPMPRRSSRNPEKILMCETPDPIAILAEHFAFMVENPFNRPTPEVVLPDQDEQSLEARYEIGDYVTLVDLPEDHPDHSKPFRIIARHHINRTFSYDHDEEDKDIDIINEDRMIDVGEDEASPKDAIDELAEDGISSLFGKSGWYYKLDRCPNSATMIMPGLALWHEDDLEFGLEDHSSDEDEDEVNQQVFYVAMPIKVEGEDDHESEEEDELVSNEPKNAASVNGADIKTLQDLPPPTDDEVA